MTDSDLDLIGLDAVRATTAMRQGELTAEAYARAILARCKQLESLNAFLMIDEECVLAAACELDTVRRRGAKLGPLHGLQLAIKDNIDVEGIPTSCNIRRFSHSPAAADATIVRALKGAGSIVLGKTNMPELCLFGAAGSSIPVNPYAGDHITGGSSSGTAVSISARMAPAGIGTDTGGSVRIPAALCGIAGLRPSLGRYPSDGIVVLCPTRDTAGPMARTVQDLALLDAAIAQCDSNLPPVRLDRLRLGSPNFFYEDLDPETALFASQQLDLLREAGAKLIEADPEGIAYLNDLVSLPVYLHELRQSLTAFIGKNVPELSLADFADEISSTGGKLLVQSLLGITEGPFALPSHAEYEAAIAVHRPALCEMYRRYFESNRLDAIVYPTTPLPARPIEQSGTLELNGRPRNSLLIYVRSTDPSSNAGIPGITVPGGLTAKGVPLALAFDGPRGSDRRLLAIAAAYEGLKPALPPPSI